VFLCGRLFRVRDWLRRRLLYGGCLVAWGNGGRMRDRDIIVLVALLGNHGVLDMSLERITGGLQWNVSMH